MAMPVSSGTRLGRYEIGSRLGAGGMGEVYLARDIELERTVAVKILNAELATNQQRMQRFVQEAKAVSALNHPNILTIHEIGGTGSSRFIVTEFVDGVTLRERMASARMKTGGMLDVATQIASALVAAHSAGIVHRDIKPENVMLRSDGYVKVLDFGLAKLTEHSTAHYSTDPEASTMLETDPGVVMGTSGYMSPEQVRGLALDARTDVFSLGVVLYEMVTGRRPFEGATTSDVMVSILEREPIPLSRWAPKIPVELERIVAKALAKDVEERYQTIKDMAIDLRHLKRQLEMVAEIERTVQPASESDATIASSSGGQQRVTMETATQAAARASYAEAAPTTSSVEYVVSEIKRHKRGALLALAVLIVATVGGAFWLYKFINPRRSNLPVPQLKIIPLTSFAGRELQPAFSPDGDRVAFVWDGEKGDNFDIYVKLIDAGTPLRLTTNPGDDRAPVWSPNGRDIAFVRYSESERSILKVSALGGPERKLYSASAAGSSAMYSGLSWSQDGKLLAFSSKAAPHEPNSIYLLSFETGETRKLTSPPAQYEGDSKPIFAPDGQSLAFTRWSVAGVNDIYLAPTAGGEPKRLTSDNQVVQSMAWSPDGREIVFSSGRASSYSLWRVSASGGKPEPMPMGARNITSLAISRRGQRLAYTTEFSDTNIWRIQIPGTTGGRDVPTRLISSTRGDVSPQYSPDGKRIVFASERSGSHEIWMCDTEGLNPVQVTFFGGPEVGTPRWSPNGQQIVFDYTTEESHRDIYLVSVEGGRPHHLIVGASNDVRPSWSKDGRWIYFGSNRGGDYQVWKVPAEGGQAVQVTKQGGLEAFESLEGKFVYYAKGSAGIWRTPTEGGEEIRIHEHARLGHWALLDKGIYFLNAKANPGPSIEFFDFATSRGTQIAKLEKGLASQVPSLAVSPGGRQILYVQVDQRGSDIMLVENFR